MNHTPFWNTDECAILERMSAAGATNAAIALALPGRSVTAVRRYRQKAHGKRQRTGKTTGPAPLARRIAALEATVGAAMQEKRVDWELVDQYLQGLEWLRVRR